MIGQNILLNLKIEFEKKSSTHGSQNKTEYFLDPLKKMAGTISDEWGENSSVLVR